MDRRHRDSHYAFLEVNNTLKVLPSISVYTLFKANHKVVKGDSS